MLDVVGPSATGLLVLAGATGWWASRRLPAAANVDRLLRRARLALVAGAVAVLAGSANVAAAALGWGTGGPAGDGWVAPVRVGLVVLPLLALWAVTLPRTWALMRRQRALDPLRWPGQRDRSEAAAPALVLPYAAATLAALAVLVVPAGTGSSTSGRMWVVVAITVTLAGATTLLGARQRAVHHRLEHPVAWSRQALERRPGCRGEGRPAGCTAARAGATADR